MDPKFAGSNPTKDNGFLRVMKVHSTTSFRGDVKLSVPCHKILQHVKVPYEYKRDTSYAKFSGRFFTKLLLLYYWMSLLVIAKKL
jgi:hypothetical protein